MDYWSTINEMIILQVNCTLQKDYTFIFIFIATEFIKKRKQ